MRFTPVEICRICFAKCSKTRPQKIDYILDPFANYIRPKRFEVTKDELEADTRDAEIGHQEIVRESC